MKRSGSRVFFLATLAVTGFFATGGTDVHAGYNVTLTSAVPIGSNFTYSYDAAITANQEQIASGNFFRIYDFAGYIPGSATAPANWTVTVANSNPTPPPAVILQYGDDPNIPNITFTYTGSVPLTGPVSLGDFTIQSIYSSGSMTTKDFVGQSTNIGTTSASLLDSRGDVAVPSLVPEPSSVLSAGIGVILLGMGYAARRRKKPTG
jgi:hypothetical protein